MYLWKVVIFRRQVKVIRDAKGIPGRYKGVSAPLQPFGLEWVCLKVRAVHRVFPHWPMDDVEKKYSEMVGSTVSRGEDNNFVISMFFTICLSMKTISKIVDSRILSSDANLSS